MPIRQAGMLESRVSTWPRDHFCRSTIAPRPSRPTTWNEFLPISIPITAITLLSFSDMACSFRWVPLTSLLADRGQEHGRTIPLTDMKIVAIAAACGFSSPEYLARLYKKRFGLQARKDRQEGRIPHQFRLHPSHA